MAQPLNELNVNVSMAQVVNLVQLTTYPTETVGALQAIWTANSVLHLAPGETRIISCPFRDDNGERCGATDVASLVPTTDYSVNELRDGSGPDYTTAASFAISMTVEATRAVVTLSNSATGSLYVTALQVRGKPIRAYDPVVIEVDDTASQTAYEKRARSLDLALQSDLLLAQSYAEYLVGRFAEPAFVASSLAVEDRAVFGGVNVFSLELYDKVTLNDRHSGADALQHWVRGVEYELTPGGFRARLFFERADDRQYCLLSKTGYAELDSATRLGF